LRGHRPAPRADHHRAPHQPRRDHPVQGLRHSPASWPLESVAEQAGSDRLPRVQRHSHPAAAAGVLKLRVRSLLDDDHPAVLAKRSHQFPAGDPGHWRHGANRRRIL
jgi:hypothetical protein